MHRISRKLSVATATAAIFFCALETQAIVDNSTTARQSSYHEGSITNRNATTPLSIANDHRHRINFAAAGGTYNLTFPEMSMPGCISFYIGEGSPLTGNLDVTIDGRGVLFGQYPTYEGEILNNTEVADSFVIPAFGWSPIAAINGIPSSNCSIETFAFSNTVMKLRANAAFDVDWEYEGGFVSFSGRSGEVANGGCLYFPQLTKDGIFGFRFKDAEAHFPALKVADNYRDIEMVFDGSKVYNNGSFIWNRSSLVVSPYTGTSWLVISNGTKFVQKSNFDVGRTDKQDIHHDIMLIDGAGSEYFQTGGYFSSYGHFDLVITNGAKFVINNNLSNAFTLGNTSDDNANAVISGRGTLFDVVNANNAKIGGQGRMLVNDGAEVQLPRTASVGSIPNANSRLDIDGTDTEVIFNSIANDNCFYVGVEANATGVFNMYDGFFGMPEPGPNNNGFRFWIGHGGSSSTPATGTINMYGGRIMEPGGIMVLGGWGNAALNMYGGELILTNSASIVFGWNANDVPVSSTINMQGGRIFSWDGITIGNGSSNSKRSCIVKLDGGELVTDLIKRANIASPLDISGDGGTIKPRQNRIDASYPYFNAFTFACGESKGLTLDTDGRNLLGFAGFTNKAGEKGKFIKAGDGQYEMRMGTDSSGAVMRCDVSQVVVKGGSILQGDATLETESDLVLDGGAYSMAGAASELIVNAIVARCGKLILDPGDFITVNAPEGIDLSGLQVEFTTAPTAGSPVACLRFVAPLSAENQAQLAQVFCSTIPPAGKHGKFIYNPETYLVSFDFVDDAEPIDPENNACWTATDAQNAVWSAYGNWSTFTVPTEQNRAVFDNAHTVQDVVVDGQVAVGAIGFKESGFKLAGDEDASITIAAEQGAAEITADSENYAEVAVKVKGTVGTTIKLNTDTGSQLKLSGPVEIAGLAKTGKGKLILGGENRIDVSAATYAGITELANTNVLGGVGKMVLVADTLDFNCEGMRLPAVEINTDGMDKKTCVLRADRDATIDRLDVKGSWEKRGSGTLTLDASAATSDMILSSTTGTGGKTANYGLSSWDDVEYPADGSPLGDAYTNGLLVSEGELVLKGDGTLNCMLDCKGQITVGMNIVNKDDFAQAKLTLDGAYLYNYTQLMSGHLAVGWGIGRSGYSLQTAPEFEVKNNSHAHIDTIRVGLNAGSAVTDLHARLTVTDSKVVAGSYYFESTVPDNYVIGRFRNSTVLMGGYPFYTAGACDVSFDNCELGGANNNTVNGVLASTFADMNKFRLGMFTYNDGVVTGRVEFVNGSLFRGRLMNYFRLQKQFEYAWDDSEWDYGKEGDFSFEGTVHDAAVDGSNVDKVSSDKFVMTMRGKGIKLRPAAGTTFTVSHPFVGEGGIQNVGAGTVRFLSGAYRFTGTASAASGATIDFTDAGVIEDAMLGGAGTFRGGTLNNAAIAVSADKPVLDGMTLTGTGYIDFGRASDDPVPESAWTNLEVATYTGSAPACAWRIRNAGAGIRGTVTAQDGRIKVTLKRLGSMLIFR